MEGSRQTRPDADTEFGLEVTMEERSDDRRIKKVAHMTERMLPSMQRLAGARRKNRANFEDFSFTTLPSPPPKPLRALALPFIKTRPLVPKKFENPKKAHIAPSQRLVAKVHPSHTSLSKGILFFVSPKKKVRIHCLCLRATSLEPAPPLHLHPRVSGRCESRPT
jgi:hypothetical protein